MMMDHFDEWWHDIYEISFAIMKYQLTSHQEWWNEIYEWWLVDKSWWTLNHPWLGMVNIPPVNMVMTGGWCKWHCFTHIKLFLSKWKASKVNYIPGTYLISAVVKLWRKQKMSEGNNSMRSNIDAGWSWFDQVIADSQMECFVVGISLW